MSILEDNRGVGEKWVCSTMLKKRIVGQTNVPVLTYASET